MTLRRRQLLLLSVAASAAVGGCASRAPAPPPPPPKPVALLAWLPVVLDLGDGEPGFGTRPGPVPRQVPVAPPPINPTALGMAIGAAIQHSRNQKEAELTSAMLSIGYDPAPDLDQRLQQALQRLAVPFVRVDASAAAELRAGRPADLPPGVEALLDVRVTDAGYGSSFGSGTFTPRLGVDAALLEAVAERTEIDSFSYDCDPRSRPQDRRWVTTPARMSFASLDALRADARSVRSGVQSLLDAVAERVAADVQRHTQGQPRLD